jgi:hypothetical protein
MLNQLKYKLKNKENVEDIQDKAEAYIESNLAYYKLRTLN